MADGDKQNRSKEGMRDKPDMNRIENPTVQSDIIKKSNDSKRENRNVK